jgi:hypothetical protein
VKMEFENTRQLLALALAERDVVQPEATAWRTLWLEACGYPGLKLLKEALADPVQTPALKRDGLGLDLQDVSCVFLADQLNQYISDNGRAFLRNVRHGLYLVPDSVEHNYGIGCPVDPSFALGGERTKNPYDEKLALARLEGLSLDDEVWQQILK